MTSHKTDAKSRSQSAPQTQLPIPPNPVVYNLSLFDKIPRKPCDFCPGTESKFFAYLPENRDNDCLDSDLAWMYISKWENQEFKDELNAADLNNLACAYLWLEEPNWQKAYEFFIKASWKEVHPGKPLPQEELQYGGLIRGILQTRSTTTLLHQIHNLIKIATNTLRRRD